MGAAPVTDINGLVPRTLALPYFLVLILQTSFVSPECILVVGQHQESELVLLLLYLFSLENFH